jgi:hypothetical protein
MKISTLYRTLRILAIVLGISVASQVSAKYFYHPAASSQTRTVKIEYAPTTDLSVFGTFNNANSGSLRILRIPVPSFAVMAFCGSGRDSSGGDTTGGNDSLDGDHGHGGFGDHEGDDDSSGGNNDTTHWGNDTIDYGHHHADNDDSTNVNDTNAHTLFNGGRQSIYVKTHSNQASVTFTFTNNLTSSVTISNIALASGRNFAITSGAPTHYNPSRLAPGAKINLKVAFTATDYSIHTDQLLIQSNSSQTASTITLQGQQVTAAASVANSLPAGVTITMAPNPMTSSMTVNLVGVTSASAAIYDLVGKQVISTPINSSQWIWNGTAKDGTTLLSGTYIVRLSGLSADGSPFVSTQKIVLQH